MVLRLFLIAYTPLGKYHELKKITRLFTCFLSYCQVIVSQRNLDISRRVRRLEKMFVITRLGYIEFFSNYPERKNTVRYTENFVKLSFLVLIFHGTVLQLCAWELFSIASGYFRNPQRVLLFFVFLIGNGETYKGAYLM